MREVEQRVGGYGGCEARGWVGHLRPHEQQGAIDDGS